MADRIAESIDATLASVGPDSGLVYDTLAPHIDNSVEIQKLINAHVQNFYSSDSTIPLRVRFAVLHSFWLGFEAGKAVATAAKMEELFR